LISNKAKGVAATKEKEVVSSDHQFRFLDVPTKIREMIYDMRTEDDQKHRERRNRSLDLSRTTRSCSKVWVAFSRFGNRDKSRRKIGPTAEQEEQEIKLRTLLINGINRRTNKARVQGVYIAGCHDAFQKYNVEHEMYTRRCPRENHN
jgi:hypothetical protein